MKKFIFKTLIAAILGAVLISCTTNRAWNEMVIIEDPEVEIKEYVNFNTKLNDVYIFDVKSSGIRADEGYEDSANSLGIVGKGYNNTSFYSASDGITNFIFVKDGTDNELKLFSSNVFIYKYQFQRLDERYSSGSNHTLNVYAVIKNDTNKDKVLNSRDNISLYVSNYDGTELTEISSSIIEFKFIDKNQFMFTEHDGKTLSYYAYNTATKNKKLIKSVEQEISQKSIMMY